MGRLVKKQHLLIARAGLGSLPYQAHASHHMTLFRSPLFGLLALSAVVLLTGCETLESLKLPWQSSETASETPEAKESTDKLLVARAQRGLAKLGYRPGPADGIPGRKTAAAIRAYQKKTDLTFDGTVSQDLVERIEQTASKLSQGTKAVRRHNASPPTYKAGSTFVYSDGRVDTVASLKGNMVRWIRNDGTRFTAHRNFLLPWYYWQSTAESGTVTLEGEPEDVWPLRTGRERKFSTQTMVQRNAGSNNLADWAEAWRCRFEGLEQLSVTAGRFKTIKFACSRDAGASSPALERTWYYAPKIGHYVRVIDATPGGKEQLTDLVAIRPSGETWPPIARAALGRAVEQALNSAKNGEEVPWTSSGVATRVTIKPTSGFRKSDGKRCRSFLQIWANKSGKYRYPGAACQASSSGRWRIPGLEENDNETFAISGGIS